jgi:phosphopantothenoylcysteine decarboxylase/phosphopantothenate--cysteine ligase
MSKPTPSEDAAAPDALHDKRVVLCVTGGIAAYKSAYLTRALVKAGAHVIVVMTESAQRFVAPLTFETLSGNRVVTDTFERAFEMGAVEHIDLATWADLVVVAPATYNFLGKLNAGIADDVVSTFMSAVTCPVFVAPAMNEHMWRNPINQRNVEALRALGYRLIDPARGGLACSWEGEGRMREPDDVLDVVRGELASVAAATPSSGATSPAPETRANTAAAGNAAAAAPLAGRTVLVTAAGTWEAIDPVRFIGNRSSGRMGYALARAARRRGARVLLASGPSALTVPQGLAAFRAVETAEQMLEVCREWLPESDVLLMAAAVADYRPRQRAADKIRRRRRALEVHLEPTPDVLASLREHKGERMFVGFALETDEPQRAAQEKLQSKGLDLIVANRVGDSTGPDTDTNQVWIYNAAGLVEETALLDKTAIAEIILDVVEREWIRRRQHAGI